MNPRDNVSGHLVRGTRLSQNEIMFEFFVISCVESVMVPLVIAFLHFVTPTTFDGRKMMPSVNLKNFGIDHFCIT